MSEEVDSNQFRDQRIEKMKRLEEMGVAPYGGAFERSGTLAETRASFEEEAAARVAGRLMTVRRMGKSIFAHLYDGTDRFQIFVRRDVIGDEAFAAFRCLDVGDHIGCIGSLFVTKTGEQSLRVDEWVMLSKALLPLPEKWHGLKDTDARYRQRYLDLIANEASRDIFRKRIEVVREIRRYLDDRDFLEVETPMMHPEAGGAAARPFVTHFEALHTDMFLRIAPELYLKRLLVGGFNAVYELNRNFRNEGLDRTHNPEFTMLEIYQAYTDMRGMKALIHGVITHVAETVFGELQFPMGEETIDLSGEWREVTYHDLLRERMGADWYDLEPEAMRAKAEAAGLDVDPASTAAQISHEIYGKLIERTLIQPTFVTRLPAELIPLAKRCEDDPSVIDVFELVIGGKEIAPAYSELNDPLEQRKRLQSQQTGEEAMNADEEFVTALEHGMPPAGGMGVGIDRLVMLLTGSEAIRDVILFPQLKPRQ